MFKLISHQVYYMHDYVVVLPFYGQHKGSVHVINLAADVNDMRYITHV